MTKTRWLSTSRQFVRRQDDPLTVWKHLNIQAPAYMLETVTGFDRTAQYSCIGFEPLFRLHERNGELEVIDLRPGRQDRKTIPGPLLESLRFILRKLGSAETPHLPPLAEAMVGYMAYDIVRQWEHLPNPPVDDLNWPVCDFLIPGKVICFDHRKGFVALGAFQFDGNLDDLVSESSSSETSALQGRHDNDDKGEQERLAAIRRQLDAELDRIVENLIHHPPKRSESTLSQFLQETNGSAREATSKRMESNIDRATFEHMVRRAQQYIDRGDIFQVVLSQRWRAPLSTAPLDVYEVLRVLNPSPHMFFFDWGDRQLVGSSPERLVRLEGSWASTRPIAGTRPRGKTALEDEQLAHELLHDPKEQAEHVMLVDLGRNDLAKVSRHGTVTVPRFMEVEHFSHVMHLISDVQGRLLDGCDAFDVLAACFPAGTLSGAPKVRAMEIIDELEPVRRGPYGGVVGYFSLQGDMETCITIRTILCDRGMAYVQAGAGIVADSDPAGEYAETENKARALVHALAISERRNLLKQEARP